jgi:hypothetical protein
VQQRCFLALLQPPAFGFLPLTRFPIRLQTKFALCEGYDGNECDVLIFPDMKRFRWVFGLNHFSFSGSRLSTLRFFYGPSVKPRAPVLWKKHAPDHLSVSSVQRSAMRFCRV